MKKAIRFLLLWVLVGIGFSDTQAQNKVSGTVLDEKGNPLIGANILIKNTTRGTVTDIEGKYTIAAKVGDILVFSYTGYDSWEKVITRNDFRQSTLNINIPQKPILPITSDDYLKAIPLNRLNRPAIKSFPADAIPYEGYFNHQNLNKIETSDLKAKLISGSDVWKYSLQFTQVFGFSYIQDGNLPERQSRFAAGNTINGAQTLLSPDAMLPITFGPEFSELTYDGLPVDNWPDGRLARRNNTNGVDIKRNSPQLFPTVFSYNTALTTRISKVSNRLILDFKNKTGKDIFGAQGFQKNRVGLNYNKKISNGSIKLGGYFEADQNKQSNQNGLANHIYQMAYISPFEFDLRHSFNQQNNQTINNNFDNPFYLLNNALDQLKNRRYNFIAGYEGKPFLGFYNLKLTFNTSFTGQRTSIRYQTANLQKGFSSGINAIEHHYQKPIWRNNLEVGYNKNRFSFSLYAEQYLENINYEFSTSNLDLPFLPFDQTINRSRNNFQMTPRITYILDSKHSIKLTAYNQVFSNSDGSFIPGLPGGLFVFTAGRILLRKLKIQNLSLTLQVNRSVFQQPLTYQNRSWYQQTFSVLDTEPFYYYPELFTSKDLNPEIRFNSSGQFRMTCFKRHLFINIGAHLSRRRDVVLPFGTLENTTLNNAGILLDHSFDIGLEYQQNTGNRSYSMNGLTLGWNMNWYRSKVKKLPEISDPVIIGGNNDVHQVLVENESAGALFGTEFQKNESGVLLIDPSGYPVKSATRVLIGDAIPDFMMNLNLRYKYERFSFSAQLEWSHGGDFWNGTQATLDYLGQSVNTVDQRFITNFTFPGIQSDGTPNTIPVNFGESRSDTDLNRWQRYGPAGVGKAYVEDASYLNLRKIEISYHSQYSSDFIQQFSLGVYANNLFSWMPAPGYSPYRSFREQENTTAIQFFNLPLNTEIGFSFKLKI